MEIRLSAHRESEDIRKLRCLMVRQDAGRMMFVQPTTQYQDAGSRALKLCFIQAN